MGEEEGIHNSLVSAWVKRYPEEDEDGLVAKSGNIYSTLPGISNYVNEYNNERPHSHHGGDYPAEVYPREAA